MRKYGIILLLLVVAGAATAYYFMGDRQASAAGQTRHYQSGVLFDALSADMAIIRTMLLLTIQEASDAAPVVYVTGTYQDRWRKTREGWRLVHRVARVDRDPGYTRYWA